MGALGGTCSSPADGAFRILTNKNMKTHMVAPARMRMLFGNAMVKEQCGEAGTQTWSYLVEMPSKSILKFHLAAA